MKDECGSRSSQPLRNRGGGGGEDGSDKLMIPSCKRKTQAPRGEETRSQLQRGGLSLLNICIF